MLNAKKMFTKLLTVTKTTFIPTSGTAYANYGGCYYEKYGRFVHLHLGMSGLTANRVNSVYTLPASVRPTTRAFSAGASGAVSAAVSVEVTEAGLVNVIPTGAYCGIDAYWIL